MKQKFLVDSLNYSLANIFGYQIGPLKHFKLADDGKSLSIFSSTERQVLLYHLESSQLKKNWWSAVPIIKNFEPSLDCETTVVECGLVYFGQNFAIWYPEVNKVQQLKLKVEEDVFEMRMISFSWIDNSDKIQKIMAIAVITHDGILYFLPLTGDNCSCYRVILPIKRASRAKFIRKSSNSVFLAIQESKTIYFIELGPDSHPSIVEKLEFDINILDFFITFTEGNSFRLIIVTIDQGEVLDYAGFHNKPSVVQRYELPKSVSNIKLHEDNNQILLLLMVDDNVHCFDPIAGVSLFYSGLKCGDFDDVCIHMSSTYLVKSLGLTSSGIIPDKTTAFQWLTPITKQENFDFLAAFDLLDSFPFSDYSLSMKIPCWKQLLSNFNHTSSSDFPRSWQELRTLFDIINQERLVERNIKVMVILYLIAFGQPNRIGSFSSNYCIPIVLQLEAQAYVSYDRGKLEELVRLSSKLDDYLLKDCIDLSLEFDIKSLLERELVVEALYTTREPKFHSNTFLILLKAVATSKFRNRFVNLSLLDDEISKTITEASRSDDEQLREFICTLLIEKRRYFDAQTVLGTLTGKKWDLFGNVIDNAKKASITARELRAVESWVPRRSRGDRQMLINNVPPKAITRQIATQLAPNSAVSSTLTKLVRIESSMAKLTHHPKLPSRLVEQVQVSDSSPMHTPTPVEISNTTSPAISADVPSPDETNFSSSPLAIKNINAAPLKSFVLHSPRLTNDNKILTETLEEERANLVSENNKKVGGRKIHGNLGALSDTSHTLEKVTIRRKQSRRHGSKIEESNNSNMHVQKSRIGSEIDKREDLETDVISPKRKKIRPASSPNSSPPYNLRDSTLISRTPQTTRIDNVITDTERPKTIYDNELFAKIETTSSTTSNPRQKRKRTKKEKALLLEKGYNANLSNSQK